MAVRPEKLRRVLLTLSAVYDRRFLDTDPLGIVRRYDRPDDREIVGFFAAGLAYGHVRAIRASLDRLVSVLGPRPSRFLEGFDPRRDARRLRGFRHRFTRGEDVALALSLLRQARERSGSLERFFLEGDDGADVTTEAAMNSFGERLFGLDARPFHPEGGVPRRSGARWLLPLPRDGSPCKRHCLYLRWMVRPDDGVDCGVWHGVSPARLVLPLDVHLQRVARALGWTRRRTATWAMALEVATAARGLDPEDPVRYDFALSRLGILGLLPRDGALTPGRLNEVMRHVCREARTDSLPR